MTETLSSLNDLRIGVVNNGPIEPTWFYDGKGYKYTARTPANKTAITVVPWKIAEHHFGLGILQEDGKIRIVRKDWKESSDKDSLLESRLASICHKKFDKPNPELPGQYIDDPIMKDWFLNKVQFKAKVMRTVMTEEDFNAA